MLVSVSMMDVSTGEGRSHFLPSDFVMLHYDSAGKAKGKKGLQKTRGWKLPCTIFKLDLGSAQGYIHSRAFKV